MTRVSDACFECGGECCKKNNPIFLRETELNKLGKKKKEMFLKDAKAITAGSTYVLYEECPYLDGHRCTIWGQGRPFDCSTYPLSFVAGKWHLGQCQMGDVVRDNDRDNETELWLKKTKDYITENLKTWTKSEIYDYENLSSPHEPEVFIC